MSTSTLGWARRSFISGSRLWPPARNLASSPCWPMQADRLLGRLGPDVVECCGDHGLPPWRSWRRRLDGGPHVLRAGGHRDVADAETGQRVDDGVDDGRGGADRAGLADALDAERVGRRRGDGVAERDRRDVAGGRHHVVGQRGRLEVAVRVVDGLLEQRLGHALDDAAVHLAVDDQRVDLHAAVVDRDVLAARRPRRSRCRPRPRRCACRTATRSSAGRR